MLPGLNVLLRVCLINNSYFNRPSLIPVWYGDDLPIKMCRMRINRKNVEHCIYESANRPRCRKHRGYIKTWTFVEIVVVAYSCCKLLQSILSY